MLKEIFVCVRNPLVYNSEIKRNVAPRVFCDRWNHLDVDLFRLLQD